MKKVLIIDKETFSRNTLKDSISGEHIVIEAASEPEAISLAFTQQPDLILLDMEMSDEDGPDICVQLKESPSTKYIPLIILSSYEQKKDIINCLHAGAEDYMIKPINTSVLLARIDAHLRTKNYYTDLDNRDLLMLLELMEIISVTRNPRRILSVIVEKMVQAIDVSRCSIISISEGGDLVVKASSDLPPHQEIVLDLRKYPEIEKALSTQRPVVLQDINNNPLMESVKENIKGLSDSEIFVVPIVKKQNIIGTFFLRTSSPVKGGITERIFKLCQVVANICGNALENAVLFESIQSTKELLEDLAVRDGLTGLYNHQYYHTRFEEEFSRAKRYNTGLACIFIDIDDFKRVNDRHGHPTGDLVIKQIAGLIKRVLRKSDVAARYGGEEFAILLTNTDNNGAVLFARRMLKLIEELSIQQLKGDQVTASMGVATYPNKNVSCYEDLLHSADRAMYQAKRSGKNQVFQAEIVADLEDTLPATCSPLPVRGLTHPSIYGKRGGLPL
jgi:two-component system, cell cycle response regulator